MAYPTGLILTYSFDAASNRTTMLDPDNRLTTYSYNAQNRITAILNPVAEITTIAYDALDRESKKTLANGMTVSHAYDASMPRAFEAEGRARRKCSRAVARHKSLQFALYLEIRFSYPSV